MTLNFQRFENVSADGRVRYNGIKMTKKTAMTERPSKFAPASNWGAA